MAIARGDAHSARHARPGGSRDCRAHSTAGAGRSRISAGARETLGDGRIVVGAGRRCAVGAPALRASAPNELGYGTGHRGGYAARPSRCADRRHARPGASAARARTGQGLATAELARVDSELRLATRCERGGHHRRVVSFSPLRWARDAVGATPGARPLSPRRSQPSDLFTGRKPYSRPLRCPGFGTCVARSGFSRGMRLALSHALEGKSVPSAALATDEQLTFA